MKKMTNVKNNVQIVVGIAFTLLLWLVLTAEVTLVDPTKPPSIIFSPKAYSASQPLLLSATFIYPNSRSAIINGVIVKVGDQVGQFTVSTIEPYQVKLTGLQNNNLILQLVTPVIKPLK